MFYQFSVWYNHGIGLYHKIICRLYSWFSALLSADFVSLKRPSAKKIVGSKISKKGVIRPIKKTKGRWCDTK